jgi:probable phosphoglycerate mutase
VTLDLWLARHGETEWSLEGKHTGRTDVPLTKRGEAKARLLGERLRGLRFDAVYTSPMQRAQRTAALAGFAEHEVTPLLQEYDYGEYEGVTTAQIKETRPDWQLFRDGCPGGETPAQVYDRARRFVELVGRRQAGTFIAFAHAHILRTVATAWLREPVLLAERLSLDTAALCLLREADRGRVMQLWNSTGEP